MRQALIKYNNIEAGLLTETDQGEYLFEYSKSYIQEYPNQFITFQMPVSKQVYRSNRLFSFFDGLIPEGWLLNIAVDNISVVPSSLIRLASGELCYLTKRIDRTSSNEKIHMIDFLQIMELEDKYMGTMERLGNTIGELSSHTLLDKYRFFELAVFNYIIGNNDMHLKNFSMILNND